MATKAKHITALDNLIGAITALGEALEEAKEVIELIANKSGTGADDEGAGKVSGSGKSAKTAGVSGKGRKPSADADDGGDVDDTADADPDLEEGGDDDDVPPPKQGTKVKPVAGKKTASAGKKPAKAAPAEDDEPDLDAVKEALTEVVQHDDLGKPVALSILKKYGAAKSTELDESHYAAVIKLCQKKLAEANEGADV